MIIDESRAPEGVIPFTGHRPSAGERPIRVAMVVGVFPHAVHPSVGIFNLRAAQALSQCVEMKVVYLRGWRPGRQILARSQYEGIPVITASVPKLPRRGGGERVNLRLCRSVGWSLVRHILRQCDLVHSVDVAYAGVRASEWARRAGIHHITEAIGSDVNEVLPQLRARGDIAGWETHLQAVTCNSRALQHAFERLYPAACKVCTTYRGVDLVRFHPDGPVLGPLANREPVRFLFLGGLPAYSNLVHRANTKGGETLMRAWQAVEPDLISAGASLLMGGQGANAERVVHWRASLRAPDRIHLVGEIAPESIPGYIRSADVVLLPSMSEGLPGVAMEAAACGRPVIGSNVGGIPEVVVHQRTGLLLPPGEVAVWSKTLSDQAAEVEGLRQMGHSARQHMQEHFDTRHYAPRILALYRQALSLPLTRCR